jgi:3D (Asp-Asp-Asp) domain-containing protein
MRRPPCLSFIRKCLILLVSFSLFKFHTNADELAPSPSPSTGPLSRNLEEMDQSTANVPSLYYNDFSCCSLTARELSPAPVVLPMLLDLFNENSLMPLDNESTKNNLIEPTPPKADLSQSKIKDKISNASNALSRGFASASSQIVRVRLTFYSGQDDQWGDRVAWDKVSRAKKGRTVAADPAVFPYGTWLHIPGFGKMRVEDTGTAVKSRAASGGRDPVIDVYVGEESEVNRLSASLPEYVEVKLLSKR